MPITLDLSTRTFWLKQIGLAECTMFAVVLTIITYRAGSDTANSTDG
jgi:hypothetical protein